MKHALSVVSLVVAGFMLLTIAEMMFFRLPENDAQAHVFLAGIFGLPFLLFLVIGLGLRRFRNWRQVTAIVILVACGVLAGTAVTMACMFQSPTLLATMPPEQIAQLRTYLADWPYGIAASILFALVGAGLALWDYQIKRSAD